MTIHILHIDDLSVIGLVHDYKSFSLTLNYNRVGNFTLAIDNRLNNAKLLFQNRIIMLEDNGLHTGIITNVSIDIDDNGDENRIITGKTLGHILSERVTNANGTNEYDFELGNAETVMKQYVEKNSVSATDESRNFQNFIVAKDKGLGEQFKWQAKFDKLSDVIEEIAEYQKLGWYISIDINRNIMYFDVYQGKDLSGEVVFSTSYGNLSSQSYVYDEYLCKNFAYVAGEINNLEVEIDEETGEIINKTETIINATTGEEMIIESPKERRIYQIGNLEAKGFNRKETFIEVAESKDEYIDIPELGMRELKSMTSLESIESKIIDNTIFEFGIDYNLGDIVSVYDDIWGIEKDLRINSITIEIDENKDYEIFLTFGEVLPLFRDKIKQELKVVKPYIKR